MKSLFLIILMLLSFPVLAHPFKNQMPLVIGVWCEYHWIQPIEREDNTTLLPSEISGYKVETLDSGIWNTEEWDTLVTAKHIRYWAADKASCYGCKDIRFSTIDTSIPPKTSSVPAYPVCPPKAPLSCQ